MRGVEPGTRIGSRVLVAKERRGTKRGWVLTVRCDCGRVDKVVTWSRSRVSPQCKPCGYAAQHTPPERDGVVGRLARAEPGLWREESAAGEVAAVVLASELGPLPLGDIGALLGVSGERVRQLEARALEKLRQAVERDGLEADDLLPSDRVEAWGIRRAS